MKHVVVVGGMHGGAWIAARLKKKLRADAEVTFVAKSAEHVLLPRVTQRLGSADSAAVKNYREELSHLHVNVVVSDVEGHDSAAKKLFLSHGSASYDALVHDPRVESDLSVPGAGEYAFPVAGPADAHRLTRHLDAQLQRASYTAPGADEAARTVLVSGADAQGVEAALALTHRYEAARVVLCDPDGSLSPGLVSQVEGAGVLVLPAVLDRVLPNAAIVDGGEQPANTVVWTGSWRLVGEELSGPGTHILSPTAPYWPTIGVSAAKEAVSWVLAYVAGEARPPSVPDRPALLRSPEGVVSDPPRFFSDLRLRWRMQRYTDL